MADRAGSEGKPGVPKEVFELDQDERWQARLEEARARREIALREKAAGKQQKPRPKPWEIEGSGVEAPPAIEPIIQERGDEKFDFADRLDTIREPKDKPEAGLASTEAPSNSEARTGAPRPKAAPEYNPAARQKPPAASGAMPEPRARPQPSLILPGAPDVAELAERYAATLEAVEEPEPTSPVPAEAEEPKVTDATEAKLVALPTAAPPPPSEDPAPLSRHRRRIGIRPLGMAFALLGLAALPFAVKAPPLEKGPGMPPVVGFRFQPALGMTWSLNQRPVETRPGEWLAPPAPGALSMVPFASPAALGDSVALPPAPSESPVGEVNWRPLQPVLPREPGVIFVPDGGGVAVPDLPGAPPSISPPAPETDRVEAPASTGAVSAPPRPASLREEPVDRPPRSPARSETVGEADPLRVTILAPPRADRRVTDEIAANVRNDGYELVRVRDVDFSISQRNLRYFHPEDRAAAERIAERYDAELRDFTWFRPSPLPGTAELWLAGRAPDDPVAGGPRDQGGTARGRSDEPVDTGSILGRVFDRLGLGTELPERSPGDGGLEIIIPGVAGQGN